jgi:hypothetical protein
MDSRGRRRCLREMIRPYIRRGGLDNPGGTGADGFRPGRSRRDGGHVCGRRL